MSLTGKSILPLGMEGHWDARGHFLRIVCWLQPHVMAPVQVPWMRHCCKVISVVNKHFPHHFCVFYLNISWKSPRLACQLSQLPAYKLGERQKLPGHFDVCSTCVCCFCGAIEVWFENLCFHKQFLSLMWISDLIFHLQCAIYKHFRAEGTQTQESSGYELFLTHTQSSRQTNFIFQFFQYTWLTYFISC